MTLRTVLVAVDAVLVEPAGRVAVGSVPAPLADALPRLRVTRALVATVAALVTSVTVGTTRTP